MYLIQSILSLNSVEYVDRENGKSIATCDHEYEFSIVHNIRTRDNETGK